jgi:predicted NBD/HSP70 family sugar kinase
MRPSRNVSRRLSERSVVETILHDGPISRASLALRTGLSKQTISEIVRDLEVEGWVAETGRTAGPVGRSAVTYQIVPGAAHVVSADVGGTKIKIGISNLVGEFVAEANEPTDQRGGHHVIEQICRMCTDALRSGHLNAQSAKLAVIGVPGVPEPATGRVKMAPNIPGLDQIDVAAGLERGLGLRVILCNDVNLATQGEAWRGAGQGVGNLAYVALGTGVGSGLIVAGELVRGANNAAGELGFLPFGADPLEAESLRIGAFERVVASSGIRRRYTELTGRSAEVVEIFDRARDGEESALAVVRETGMLLAAGVASICVIVNPQKVVIGGSIGSRVELIEEVRAALPRYLASAVEVEGGALGSRASLVGAAAVGLGRLHNSLFGGDIGGERITLPVGEPKASPDRRFGKKNTALDVAADHPSTRVVQSNLRGVEAPVTAKPGRQA